VVAAHDAALGEVIEGTADGGERAVEAGGERVEVGVFVLADEGLDEVGALFVGLGCGRARSVAKRSR
jgi:hypothetical protein